MRFLLQSGATRALVVRWVLDGRVVDAAEGEAQPASADAVLARIVDAEQAAARMVAVIRAAQSADAVPVTVASAPLLVLNSFHEFVDTGMSVIQVEAPELPSLEALCVAALPGDLAEQADAVVGIKVRLRRGLRVSQT